MINTYINLPVTQPYYGAQMSRYLITLDSEVHANNAAAQTAITSAGASVIKSYAFTMTFEIEATAEQLAIVAGVKESIEKTATTVVSVQELNQVHLNNLAATSDSGATTYQPEDTGLGGHVYLIDTGLYAEHEQFTGRTINNLYSNFGSDFTDNTGHGTAVASVIIGNTQGVSKDATLHVVKLFDTNTGNITVGEIVDALDEVLSHHLGSTPSQVKVVCLPWVTAQNNFLDNKIIEMNASNLVVVAAAGNDGADVNTVSPAGVDVVLTVGAYNQDYEVTSFTNVPWTDPATPYNNNYGAALDVFALGVNVSCATTTSDNAYGLFSGTSISSGLVAGAAVQWINKLPTKTSVEIKDIILQEGHLLGMNILTFDEGSTISTSSVNRSVLTVALAGQITLGNLPSGRILNVQLGQTVTKDLELNLANGEDFSILNFAPLPPWCVLDAATGILSIDTSEIDPSLAPGSYLFGIKGTISGKTVVEEYSIGLYNTSESELEESSQYYYDSDTDSYDEVVSYQVAPKFK
jgi:subtilisin family serine protease